MGGAEWGDSTCEKLSQEDHGKFGDSLGYAVKTRLIWAIEGGPVTTNQLNKENQN